MPLILHKLPVAAEVMRHPLEAVTVTMG
jgi:hypothetical protein